MSNFLIISVAPIFFYGVTILTQYGYNSYFNIPYNLIDSSLKENIIYFFQLFQLASSVVGLMKWWMWFVVVLVLIIILFLFFSNSFWRRIIIFSCVILLLVLLYGSYGFGTSLAENATEFYTPSQECSLLEKNVSFIIPNFYGEKAILVPIDNNRKINGGVLVRNLSELGCLIEKRNIGQILK